MFQISPVNKRPTPSHCCPTRVLPRTTDEIKMLKNFRVVVTSVRVRAPNLFIVRNMNNCPRAPHKQNVRTSSKDFGCERRKATNS
mmetsp:Transcript_6488/g.11856  ORF Transcript_6488/g.11856 Transcript_6488/m.11856 type:complete len:85 (-) Transcript_6488:774-1028(-)